VQYLNTDFDIQSANDLSRLIEEFGEDVDVLFHGEIKGYRAASFNLSEPFLGPDEAINSFCLFVEQLPAEVRRIWDGCVSRIIDIGFESDESLTNYRVEIRDSTIRRVAAINATIVITLYPMRNNDSQPHS
jgi:hypothetical protein